MFSLGRVEDEKNWTKSSSVLSLSGFPFYEIFCNNSLNSGFSMILNLLNLLQGLHKLKFIVENWTYIFKCTSNPFQFCVLKKKKDIVKILQP